MREQFKNLFRTLRLSCILDYIHITVYYFNDERMLPRKKYFIIQGNFNNTKLYENLYTIFVPRDKIKAYFYFVLHLQGEMLKDLITTQYELASY